MTDIKIKSIRKNFFTLKRGKVEALKNISFDIEKGKFFVLLGPSGCGKSTLLNILAGIENPSEGEIFFNDKAVVSVKDKIFLTPKERDVAMVFQSYALYPHMTAYQNIAFPLKIAKVEKNKIDEKVKKAADILEINKILNAKPAEMSGGQRQRVALGRAIVREPNVLLLDEPLSNLDAMLRISMRSELKQIQRNLNLTTIYVTHDQTEAMSLGDKIAVMKDGLVQQIDEPDKIYYDPDNLFVARFIGSPPINIIPPSKLKTDDSEDVVLGLRPEDISIVNKDERSVTAKIKMVGPVGSESIVYLDLQGTEILAKADKNKKFNEGEEVGIKFTNDVVYKFKKDTGERIK